MKTLGLVLVLCGAVGMALLPASAYAFEIQGGGPNDPDNVAKFESLNPAYVLPKFEGSSLAMPYSGSDTGFSGHISGYGNSIPIPAPGVSLPSPAWAAHPTQ